MKTYLLAGTGLAVAAAIAIGPELACGITHDDYETFCRLYNNQASERGTYAIQSYGLACTVDSDCAVVNASVSCDFVCPTVGTAAAAAALPATLADIESSACAQYTANGCAAPLIPPCVGTPVPVCIAGHCAAASFDAGAPVSDASAPQDASDGDAADAADADDSAADAGDAATDAADAGDASDGADAADAGDADAHVDAG